MVPDTTKRMRALYVFMMTLMLLMGGGARADTLGDGTRHLTMTLVPESATPAAGTTIDLALDSRPAAGWHGYWQNPGDAGFPARFDWTVPRGVRVSAPRYPVPEALVVAGLMNHVYARPYAPIVRVTIPAGLSRGTRLPLRVAGDYLVCTDALCVPERATLDTVLTVGDGRIDPAPRARFDAWRRALPVPLDADARWQRMGTEALRIAVPFPAGASLSEPHFFAATNAPLTLAARQTFTRDGDRLLIDTAGAGTATFAGILRTGPDRGLIVRVVRGEVAGPATGDRVIGTVAAALFGAIVGGLILNVMPCVFPILSLKALSLARGHLAPGAARREAVAYTAGVVAMCLLLGGTVLALRAGGAAAGWAFQLQEPRTVLLLLLLTTGIAFNLAGLFEVPTPRVASRAGAAGAFAAGVLAAVIATPCSGPFMAAALGSALILPWPAALAVFAGLGFGVALPFLAIGFVPALRRRLPQPGAWMATFRRVLAVPMFLTAIALGWVLGRQAGADALSLALLAVLALGVVLWIAGLRQRRGGGLRLGDGVAVLALALGATMLLPRDAPPTRMTAAGAEPFNEERLAALRAEGRPVFAYFTADWCLSCKVNERTAIDTAAVRAVFARKRVAVLIGDWTDGDPALGRFIAAHGRAGVPLYLFYPAGGREARELPQVLTPGMLAAL